SDLLAEINPIESDLSRRLSPKTQAYHEIWLDGEKVIDTSDQELEPLYGKTYLTRKLRIGIELTHSNDIDVLSQDNGLISISEDGELVGFNLTDGGGMGMKHGNTATYPQVGRLIGYFPKSQVIDVCEKILTIQRDHGNREERTNARFKYTVDRKG